VKVLVFFCRSSNTRSEIEGSLIEVLLIFRERGKWKGKEVLYVFIRFLTF